MFDIYCRHCEERVLRSTSQIISMHQTSNGPIAYVRCLRDHILIKEFRTGTTRSAEPGAETQKLAS